MNEPEKPEKPDKRKQKKIPESVWLTIQGRYQAGEKMVALSREFGVSTSTISDRVQRHSWKKPAMDAVKRLNDDMEEKMSNQLKLLMQTLDVCLQLHADLLGKLLEVDSLTLSARDRFFILERSSRVIQNHIGAVRNLRISREETARPEQDPLDLLIKSFFNIEVKGNEN